MRALYGVLASLVIALGVLHMAATFQRHETFTPAALWFFNGGLVLAITGALNFLNRAYRGELRGLRLFTAGVNVVVLAFSTVGGIVTGASVAQLVIVLGVMGGMTILSLLRLSR